MSTARALQAMVQTLVLQRVLKSEDLIQIMDTLIDEVRALASTTAPQGDHYYRLTTGSVGIEPARISRRLDCLSRYAAMGMGSRAA
jgi:hypothetical protein